MSYCIVITTCEKREEAERLAAKMVEHKLAACVQLSEIVSYYTWKDKVCHDPEIKLLIKTKKALYDELEHFIKENHSYDIPEIVALDLSAGSKEYKGWIDEVVSVHP